jgi:predicted RNase H-like nuclease (RuvC/YqgF family)
MYSEKFVEELLEMVGRLANENKHLQRLITEQDKHIARLHGEPVAALANRMPSYPSKGTAEEIATWWQLWRDLFAHLKAVERSTDQAVDIGDGLTAHPAVLAAILPDDK